MAVKPTYEALEERIKTLETEIVAWEQTQHLLQRLIDTIEGEAFVKDTRGNYLFVNKAFGKNFAVDPKDVIGKDDYFVFPPDTAAKLQENDQRIMAAKKAENVEESGMVKGRYLTYLTNKVPLIDDDGNVFGICGVGFDITRQKELEAELRASEEKYQTLVQNSYDVVYSVTPEGIIAFVGPQITRFGYKPEELISKKFIEYVALEQSQEVLNRFKEGTRGGTSFPTEFLFVGKDGRRHWVEAVGKTLYDESENPFLQVGVLRDIGKRKRAEEALRDAHLDLERQVDERTAELTQTVEQLRKAEVRYRTVADFTHAWEYWANLDGTLEYVSPSCERVSGYTPQEFLNNPSLLRDIIIGEDQHLWDGHYIDSRKNPGAREMIFQIRHRDGAVLWIEHVCQPVIGDQGELLGFRASNRDITHRKEGEISLKNAYSEIAELKRQLEADRTYLREEIKLEHDYENIIGNSDVLKYVLFRAEQVAPTDTTALILGETGTGKELIARAIHNASPRKERPLIKVDCASLPANLIESELFGHEKGAFTGATEKRLGRFELADGASLFLDEIGELPLDLQPKLLRILQDGEFERLGSSRTLRTDVRVIAATNRNLEEDVLQKHFRMDLWFRLSVFTISIPPLRERSEDIDLLVNHMVKQFERRLGKRIRTVPTDVLAKLKSYSWPGNVRELENVIERAVINTQGDTLQLEDVLDAHRSENAESPDLPIKSLEEMEREHILLALRRTNWKIHGEDGAAALLDINPSTLRGRMRKQGIHRPPYET